MMQFSMSATAEQDGRIELSVQGGQSIILTRDQWQDAFVLVAATMYHDHPTDLRQYAQDAKIRDALQTVTGLLEDVLSA